MFKDFDVEIFYMMILKNGMVLFFGEYVDEGVVVGGMVWDFSNM